MTDSDKSEFAGAITALGVAFGLAVDRSTLAAYWQFLSDLSIESFRRGVQTAGRASKFFPRPSELRELSGSGAKTKALIAWDAVRAALRKYSYTQSVDFGPLVNAVVRSMGGWNHLDSMPTDELNVWGKKEFERVYDLLSPKPLAELNGSALAGSFGGPAVPVSIPGEVAPQLKLEPTNVLSELVRELAEAKS